MIERRTYEQIEIRAEGDDKSRRLIGHAAVFNKKSEEIFGFREVVLPGAFKASIKKDDIRALWNHDPSYILGRNKAGTLHLREDDQGLRTEIDLPDTQFARDLWQSVKRGDVDQMSFGFRTVSDAWRKEGGVVIRELIEADLFDVSPVTYPAYPQTDISARGFYEARMKLTDPASAPEIVIPKIDISDEEFAARAKARREIIARLTPPADPTSLREILKRCREQVA